MLFAALSLPGAATLLKLTVFCRATEETPRYIASIGKPGPESGSAHRLFFPDGALERQADLGHYSASPSGSDESEDDSQPDDLRQHRQTIAGPCTRGPDVEFLPYVPYRKSTIQPGARTGGATRGQDKDDSQHRGAEEEEDRIDELFSAYSHILFASRSMRSAALRAKKEANRADRYVPSADTSMLKGPLGKQPGSSIPEHIRLSVAESMARMRRNESELHTCIEGLLSKRSCHGAAHAAHASVGVSREWADWSAQPVLDYASYQWLRTFIRQRSSAIVLPLGADVTAPQTSSPRRRSMSPRARVQPAERHGWMDDWRLIGRDGTGRCLVCSRMPCICWDGSTRALHASLGRDTSVLSSIGSARLGGPGDPCPEKRPAAAGMGITGKILEQQEVASAQPSQYGGGAQEARSEWHNEARSARGGDDKLAAERRRWLEENRLKEDEEEDARFARFHEAYLQQEMIKALEPSFSSITPRTRAVGQGHRCQAHEHEGSRNASSLRSGGGHLCSWRIGSEQHVREGWGKLGQEEKVSARGQAPLARWRTSIPQGPDIERCPHERRLFQLAPAHPCQWISA